MAARWRFHPAWHLTVAYTYNDQIYTDYDERITSGATSRSFSRVGNAIPGISPNEVTARLGYDQPDGPLKGIGGFVEYIRKDAFFLDNGNLLRAPGYDLVNLNLHYNAELSDEHLKSVSMFVEARNLFDKVYVASANNVTNTITAAGLQDPAGVLAVSRTGSIYAGAPLTFVGGMKLAFK